MKIQCNDVIMMSVDEYLSSRPRTLVLISPWYLEVPVAGSDECRQSGDVLLEHLVTVNVSLLVGIESCGQGVQLREDHPLHCFPAMMIC